MRARHRRRKNRGLATALAAALALTGTALYSTVSGQNAEAAGSGGAVKLHFVTANTAFDRPGDAANWKKLARSNADVVFLQELRYTDMQSLVDERTWRVFQKTSSEDRRGSAVVVRRSSFAGVRKGSFDLVKGAAGSGCRNPKNRTGKGVGTRWITEVQLRLENGQWLRVAALHMPPDRCAYGPKSPYGQMTGNVIRFVRSHPKRLTVLGADWNRTVDADPNGIGRKTGLEPNGPDDGKRIDGFMYTKSLKNCCLKRLAPINSDHRPIEITLSIPAP